MQDVVDALAGGPHAGDVLKVHLLEGDGVADVGEVIEVPVERLSMPRPRAPARRERGRGLNR
jgi:hypothetical protein